MKENILMVLIKTTIFERYFRWLWYYLGIIMFKFSYNCLGLIVDSMIDLSLVALCLTGCKL